MKAVTPLWRFDRSTDVVPYTPSGIPGRWRPITAPELEADDAKAQLLRAIQDSLDEHKETV